MIRYIGTSGSNSIVRPYLENEYKSSDDMWNNMYITPKPVIIVCGHCKSHNALGNPTCIQCGAPMGNGYRYE